EVLSLIPIDKLMLLGKHIEGLCGAVDSVYENYEKDIYEALEKFLVPLSKYNMIKLVFPDNSDYPKAIIKGFYKFCSQYAFDHILVSNVLEEPIQKRECYINLAENDLELLLEMSIKKGLIIGQDIGIISYNETALKKFIINGIATMSTDFELMGKYAAQLIKNKDKSQVEVPFHVYIRPSI